jgi:hypothetical protein
MEVTKMLATLTKPVRDNCERWHMVGEHVASVSMTKRAEFDARLLINVVFADGGHGALFSDEIQLGFPFLESNFSETAGEELNLLPASNASLQIPVSHS